MKKESQKKWDELLKDAEDSVGSLGIKTISGRARCMPLANTALAPPRCNIGFFAAFKNSDMGYKKDNNGKVTLRFIQLGSHD